MLNLGTYGILVNWDTAGFFVSTVVLKGTWRFMGSYDPTILVAAFLMQS